MPKHTSKKPREKWWPISFFEFQARRRHGRDVMLARKMSEDVARAYMEWRLMSLKSALRWDKFLEERQRRAK